MKTKFGLQKERENGGEEKEKRRREEEEEEEKEKKKRRRGRRRSQAKRYGTNLEYEFLYEFPYNCMVISCLQT